MVKQKKIKYCFNYFNEIQSGYFEEYNHIDNEYATVHDSNTRVSFIEIISNKLSASLLCRYISEVRRQIQAVFNHFPESRSAFPVYQCRSPQPKHHASDAMRRIPEYQSRIFFIMSRIPKMSGCIFFFMSRTHALLNCVPACLCHVPVTISQDPMSSRNSSIGEQRLPVLFNFIIFSARSFPVLNGK